MLLLMRAYQTELFEQSVPISGHTTKRGGYVRPHIAKRRKRAAAPKNTSEDLFAKLDQAGTATTAATEKPATTIVEHVTKKGKKLRGIIRRDLDLAAAKEIDPYTFRKDGGFFIREQHLSEKTEPPAPAPEKPAPRTDLAEKLRALAAGMSERINAKMQPAISRQNATVRRARIAAHMAQEGEALARTQQILSELADRISAGTLPTELQAISSRSDVEFLKQAYVPRWTWNGEAWQEKELMTSAKGMPGTANALRYLSSHSGPLNSGNIPHIKTLLAKLEDSHKKIPYFAKTLKNSITHWQRAERLGVLDPKTGAIDEARFRAAQQALLRITPASNAAPANTARMLEQQLLGQKIPGYFPTPAAIVHRMLDKAKIRPGMRVLEPSAGKGNIADLIRDVAPDAELSVIETNPSLRDILHAKGHRLIGHDFLEHDNEQYDRIIMNPPFERGQDVQHVTHAYHLLKPGGRLVAIMSAHPFFADDAASREFRTLFHNGEYKPLLAGELADKSVTQRSNVKGYLVVLEKPQ